MSGPIARQASFRLRKVDQRVIAPIDQVREADQGNGEQDFDDLSGRETDLLYEGQYGARIRQKGKLPFATSQG